MQCRIVAHSIPFLQLCFSCKYGVRNYVLIWSTNDCSLVSTAKDGTRYVDDELFGRVLPICSIGVIVGCIINILSVLYSCFLPFVKKKQCEGWGGSLFFVTFADI